MVGIQVTALQIQSAAGAIALDLKRAYSNAVSLNEFLLRTPDADLVELGISQADVATIKSALADLAFQKTSAFDSSQFVKRLYGMGL